HVVISSMGGLGIGKPYYQGEDEFNGIEGFLYDFESYAMLKRWDDNALKVSIVRKIKGNSDDEQVKIENKLEERNIELA
ncbi:26249_t:CDS:2, partial [Dentiscutata erythropus]